MPTLPRPDPTRIIELCHQGLYPWRTARKLAVNQYRDLRNFHEVARLMNTTAQWVRKWWNRFLEAGKNWSSLDTRSSKPHTLHAKRHAHENAILEAKAQHPDLGALKLKTVANIPLSHDTIHRVLLEHGLVKLAKKTWRKYRRFQRPTPNYLWQIDITQVPTKNQGFVWVLTVIDDCTRFVLASRTFTQELNTADVLAVVRDAMRMWGKPRQILTDRGSQFCVQGDEPSLFTLTLHAFGVQHLKARPRHPRTLGKIERWHRSFKEWLDHHPQPADRAALLELLTRWVDYYNTQRPHWALRNRPPVEAYAEGLYMNDLIYRVVNEVA